MRRSWAGILVLLLCLPDSPALARSGQATFRVDVPAREWKGLRVKNIPSGARLAVEVRSDRPLAVALLDAESFARFPGPEPSLFRGRAQERLSFSVLAPTTGDYYVVLDNRDGTETRTVELTVTGETDDDGAASADAQAQLREFQDRLRQLFVFEPFSIQLARCGEPEATAGAEGVVICAEYAKQVQERMRDPAKVGDVLLFTLFHELGHVLLEQWRYPLYENEEAADEFAAAVLVMLDQGERARPAIEFFRTSPSFVEAIARAFRDDRHPLSQQRARNLERWLADPELVRRWQTIFVPHMQTAVLERLDRAPRPWVDVALVQSQLAARQ